MFCKVVIDPEVLALPALCFRLCDVQHLCELETFAFDAGVCSALMQTRSPDMTLAICEAGKNTGGTGSMYTCM